MSRNEGSAGRRVGEGMSAMAVATREANGAGRSQLPSRQGLARPTLPTSLRQ